MTPVRLKDIKSDQKFIEIDQWRWMEYSAMEDPKLVGNSWHCPVRVLSMDGEPQLTYNVRILEEPFDCPEDYALKLRVL